MSLKIEAIGIRDPTAVVLEPGRPDLDRVGGGRARRNTVV